MAAASSGGSASVTPPCQEVVQSHAYARSRTSEPEAQLSSSGSAQAKTNVSTAQVRCHLVVLACSISVDEAVGAEDAHALTLRLHQAVHARVAQLGEGFVAEASSSLVIVYMGYPHAVEGGEEKACALTLAIDSCGESDCDGYYCKKKSQVCARAQQILYYRSSYSSTNVLEYCTVQYRVGIFSGAVELFMVSIIRLSP